MSVLNCSPVILSACRVTSTITRKSNVWRIPCWPINLIHTHCSSVSLPAFVLQLRSRKLQSALTKDLNFNVSWLFNELLNKQGTISKCRQSFGVGPLVILLEFLLNRPEKYIYYQVSAGVETKYCSCRKRVCIVFEGVLLLWNQAIYCI